MGSLNAKRLGWFVAALVAIPLSAHAARQIFPAGSLISCRITEAKLSSKTATVDDPILCQVGITSRNGPGRLPFDSYLEGRFEDFKDPGHFYGKGWMELKFDRMIVEPRTIIPLSARVVDVPNARESVDTAGRIVGPVRRGVWRSRADWASLLLLAARPVAAAALLTAVTVERAERHRRIAYAPGVEMTLALTSALPVPARSVAALPPAPDGVVNALAAVTH